MSRNKFPLLLVMYLGFSCWPPTAGQGAESAKAILTDTGIQGGFVVHLGCGNGQLTADLQAGDRYRVHGLDSDATNVAKARDYLQQRGVDDRVFVMHWTGTRLPYADNLVNLLVADGLGEVTMDEVMRVLTPLGVALIDGEKTIKPWPAEIDQWTHWLHSADGNAVAQDTVAGPPRRMQWIAGPLWSRHHNTAPSTSAMVSARGRLFYIVDEAPAGMDGSAPDKWSLVARDAFNGLPLWKRSMPEWGWKTWSTDWKSRFTVPTHLPRRLVAIDDRVYVTLGFNAPLTELDAATGEVTRVLEGTQWTDEILFHDGQLILSINQSPQEPSRAMAGRRGVDDDEPVNKSVAVIDAESGRLIWKKGDYVGLRSKTGSMDRISHLSMCVGDGHVFFVDRDRIIGLDLRTGREAWNVARPEVPENKMRYNIRITDMCTLVYNDNRVYFAQLDPDRRIDWREIRGRLHALSAKNGEQLWNHQCASWGWGHPADVFVIDGLVWVHDYQGGPRTGKEGQPRSAADLATGSSWVGSRASRVVGIDPATGEVCKTISNFEAFDNGHHHRCYRNKATTRFMMTSFRGLEFLPFDGTETTLHHWVRGTCRLGPIPCNGLVYANPHPCSCYISSKLNGYLALAPAENADAAGEAPKSVVVKPAIGTLAGSGDPRPAAAGDPQPAASGDARPAAAGDRQPAQVRLVEGPAYPAFTDQETESNDPADWPTYRYNSERQGTTRSPLSSELSKVWEVDVGSRPSACVAVGDTVLSAAVDAHRVVALDASSGRPKWTQPAGGRVDTPPTIHGGHAYFGSADGHVYCVRMSDGQLAWRFRGAPEQRMVGAFGSVESAWPVHGAVLIREDAVHFTAGRSSFLDGGIYAFALDTRSGEVIAQQQLSTPYDLKVAWGREQSEQTGLLADVLVSQGDAIYMRQHVLFPTDGQSAPGTPLRSTSGLLDDTWFSRTRWHLGERPVAEYCVFDANTVYGVAARSGMNDNGGFITPGGEGYELFAADRSGKKRWSLRVPIRVTAMLCAGGTLFAAGTPDIIDANDPWAAYEGRRGGWLLAISADDGSIRRKYELEAPPVLDGLAAARGRLFLSAIDGKIHCFGD